MEVVLERRFGSEPGVGRELSPHPVGTMGWDAQGSGGGGALPLPCRGGADALRALERGGPRQQADLAGKARVSRATQGLPLSLSHSMACGSRFTVPNRCSTAATRRLRMSSPEIPAVVPR